MLNFQYYSLYIMHTIVNFKIFTCPFIKYYFLQDCTDLSVHFAFYSYTHTNTSAHFLYRASKQTGHTSNPNQHNCLRFERLAKQPCLPEVPRARGNLPEVP